MLKIYINNVSVDILDSTSIKIKLSNPMFEDDLVPVPYTLGFDLPATPHNLELFDHPNRLVATSKITQLRSGEIFFAGLPMLRGSVEICSITSSTISVQIVSDGFTSNQDKKLYQLPLPRVEFGDLTRVQWSSLISYIKPKPETTLAYAEYWSDLIAESDPDYLVAPIAIAGVDTYHSLSVINDLFTGFADGTGTRTSYSALIPSVKLSTLFGYILPNSVNIIEALPELANLYLICYYHPSYRGADTTRGRVGDDYNCWTLDKEAMIAYMDIAECLPDVTCSQFLSELLKVLSASLYVVDGVPTVTFNKDVLQGQASINWSDKLLDGYTLEIAKAEAYRFSYSSASDNDISADEIIEEFGSATNMILDNSIEPPMARCTVSGQYFERSHDDSQNFNPPHVKYSLIADSVATWGATDKEAEELDREVYEVSTAISPVRMVVKEIPLSGIVNNDDSVSGYSYFICPEVEAIEEHKRPSALILGYYIGNRSAGGGSSANSYVYPGINATGGYLQTSLVPGHNTQNLVDMYHTAISEWLGTYRRNIKGEVILSAAEVNKFDFRAKVHVKGRNYIVKSLEYTLTVHAIEPCEVELIEA